MTIRHHPQDESLVRFAAGTLEAGPAVVAASHLAVCPQCRTRVAHFEALGGALLEELPPTPVAPEALALTLAAIDAHRVTAAGSPQICRRPPPLPGGVELPAPLHAYEIGRWRWLAPGLRCCRITVPRDPQANVLLFRIAPKTKLAVHGHTGTEFTQVIRGSFSDGRSHYEEGDWVEADIEVDHQPVVDSDSECICLIAMEGQMRLRGFVGWLLQPFVGL